MGHQPCLPLLWNLRPLESSNLQASPAEPAGSVLWLCYAPGWKNRLLFFWCLAHFIQDSKMETKQTTTKPHLFLNDWDWIVPNFPWSPHQTCRTSAAIGPSGGNTGSAVAPRASSARSHLTEAEAVWQSLGCVPWGPPGMIVNMINLSPIGSMYGIYMLTFGVYWW